MRWDIHQTKPFARALIKLLDKKRINFTQIDKVLSTMSVDPFTNSLNTHKVISKQYKLCYSSRVDGDLRIIWNFNKEKKLTILALDIGGHSGSASVY